MSQGEFIGPVGITFTVTLRNPATYASVQSGISCTSPTPGVYRFDATGTGLVFVEAVSGDLRLSGYANLDVPGATGYSEVLDSYAAAAALGAGSVDIAEDIAAINSKIQTGIVSVVSPVNEDGSVNPIVIGDDYKAVDGRALDFFVDPIAGVNVGDCQCTFGAEADHRGKFLVRGVVSAQTVDGLPKWRMRFEIDGDETSDCRPGCYEFGATLIPSTRRATKITGPVELVASHTME